MKKWSKIATIVFILFLVLSIMTSKTEVTQLDYESGIGIQIQHERKLFFIHSFRIVVDNETGQSIKINQPLTFTLEQEKPIQKVGSLERLESGERVISEKESIWRFAKTFNLTATVTYEMNGQQQVIEISERLGD